MTKPLDRPMMHAHEFFGMGGVVADARTAVQQAGTALRGAFGR